MIILTNTNRDTASLVKFIVKKEGRSKGTVKSKQTRLNKTTDLAEAANLEETTKLKKATELEETVEIIVHKQVACHRSPVLRAAFNGPYIEGQEQSYYLEGVTERTAQFLVQWLYTEKLVIDRLKDDWVDSDVNRGEAREDYDLMDLWILGDFLQMPALQNYTIKAVERIRIKTDYIPASCYDSGSTLFESTAKDSKLRQFFCHQVVVGTNQYREFTEDAPHEMLLDVLYLLGKGIKWGDALNVKDFYVKEDVVEKGGI